MKRVFIIIATIVAGSGVLNAQTSLEDVLRSIEANNKELRASMSMTAAKKLEAKTENNLPDPSVSYTHQYGNREGMGFQGELVASQSFDFPSLYVQRHKLAKDRSVVFDREHSALRQQVLLQAKNICLDLILLNQQKALLDQRKKNAEELSKLYAVRLQNGDANILETNKIELELLNVKNEVRLNEAARTTKLQELMALNGGEVINFSDTEYPETKDFSLEYADFCREALSANPELQVLTGEKAAALRNVTVSKHQGLPELELGYRMNPSSGGERYNGFLVGVSIPLFSNRNKVKLAKAQQLYAETMLDNTTTQVNTELPGLWNRAEALRASMNEYKEVLGRQNSLELLNKAIQSGQISMIEYFVDVTTLYQSIENYQQIQNEYQLVIAQLYKYRL